MKNKTKIVSIWVHISLIVASLSQLLFLFTATFYFNLIMLMPGRYFSYDYYVWMCTERVQLPYEIEAMQIILILRSIFSVLFLIGFLFFLFYRPLRSSISIRRLLLLMAAGTLTNAAIYAYIYFRVTDYRLFMMLLPLETTSLLYLYLVHRGRTTAKPLQT